MRVWLVTVGEPLPIEGNKDRILRAGILADMLFKEGHEVLWWTSTFDHVRKRQRCGTDTKKALDDRYRINMLHANGYRNNISFSRLLDHRGVAEKFRRFSETEQVPDVILCSLPTLELCVEAVRYGERKHVPVVIDIRDLWPDLIAELAPPWGRGAIKLLLTPMFNDVREACTKAAAIFALTPEFLQWGLGYAGRDAGVWDKVFPMGYTSLSPLREEVEEAMANWRSFGVEKGDFNICYFGAIGHQSDFKTVINAAKILLEGPRNFRFVICGSGDKLEYHKKGGMGCSNVLFPGWVNRTDIWSLMRISSAGLVAFVNKSNYTLNLPNKPIEYLSAGLPIVSSLSGVLARLLSENLCGVTYEEGRPDSLAAALVRLYDDRDALGAMSRNARALYERSFVAEQVYGEMIRHLCRITEEWDPKKIDNALET
jgi:glycosyltransferase involved in cell wall biosynthesis